MMARMCAKYIRRCGQACNVQRYRHGKLSGKEAVTHGVGSVARNR